MSGRSWSAARRRHAERTQAKRQEALALYHSLWKMPLATLYTAATSILRGRMLPSGFKITPLRIVAIRYDVMPNTVKRWLREESTAPLDNSDLI